MFAGITMLHARSMLYKYKSAAAAAACVAACVVCHKLAAQAQPQTKVDDYSIATYNSKSSFQA
jgi:hypothetical protein